MMRRLLVVGILISASCLFADCVSRNVQVPVLLTPVQDASLAELVGIIGQYQAIQTLTARLDIQFQSERHVEQGLSRQYRTAEGRIVLARPGKIRLQIQIPVVKTNVAELASDGEKFEVIVYPEEYRVFIRGTNGRRYTDTRSSRKVSHRPEEAGGFARIRPEHFTDALLFPAVDLNDLNSVVVKEEFQNVEPDPRPNAPKGRRIIRTYSIMSVIEHHPGKQATLRRKYWFDRTRNLLLVREQIYGEKGELLSDISYDDMIRPAQFNGFLPTKIRINRPHDDYSVTMILDAPTLTINSDVPQQAFRVEKPAEWGDTVDTIDLDELSKTP
jgi:hypothetical protein